MPNHRLGHPAQAKHKVPGVPQWPSYTGTSTFVGTSASGKVNVWYDASLGPQALANAQALLQAADAVVSFDTTTFGAVDGVSNVIVFALGGATDGTGGADHMGCDFATGENIEVCASFGRNDRVIALFEAELSECQMRGNLCGYSTGEALSRWCSMLVPGSNNALADFASAPTWQQDDYPNWVDRTNPTDGDYDSIGCGIVFIGWLLAKKGYTLSQVAQAMVSLGDNSTLASVYEKLSGTTGSPWSAFLMDVKALGPITSDDPFGVLSKTPTPPPSPPPSPPPPPPSPPVPPTPPVPVSVVMEIIDQMFAAAEAGAKGEPLVEGALVVIQQWADQDVPALVTALEDSLWNLVLTNLETKIDKHPVMSLMKDDLMTRLRGSLDQARSALPPGTLVSFFQTLLQDAPQILQLIQALMQAWPHGK